MKRSIASTVSQGITKVLITNAKKIHPIQTNVQVSKLLEEVPHGAKFVKMVILLFQAINVKVKILLLLTVVNIIVIFQVII